MHYHYYKNIVSRAFMNHVVVNLRPFARCRYWHINALTRRHYDVAHDQSSGKLVTLHNITSPSFERLFSNYPCVPSRVTDPFSTADTHISQTVAADIRPLIHGARNFICSFNFWSHCMIALRLVVRFREWSTAQETDVAKRWPKYKSIKNGLVSGTRNVT